MKPGNSKTIDEITRILRTPSLEMSDEEQVLRVMKYLENLIAWADNLFQQDTVESINEATELYVLAASILGTPNSGARPAASSLALAIPPLSAARAAASCWAIAIPSPTDSSRFATA